MFNRCFALLFLAVATGSLPAQEAFTDGLSSSFPRLIAPQPPPSSAWLDLRQNASAKAQTAPNWVEAVGMIPARTKDAKGKTVFRIRVQPRPALTGCCFSGFSST